MENKRFDFKKPAIAQERGWFERIFFSKSMLFVVVGAALTSTYYYFTEWQDYSVITYKDIIEGVSVGALVGYFMANSPCANNKC
jgi:hypothetical protein